MENPTGTESHNSESIQFPEKLSGVKIFYDVIKEAYRQMQEELQEAYHKIDSQTSSQKRSGFHEIIRVLGERELLPDSVFLESESMKIIKKECHEIPDPPDRIYYLPKSNGICRVKTRWKIDVVSSLDQKDLRVERLSEMLETLAQDHNPQGKEFIGFDKLKSAGNLPSDISFEPVGKDTAYGELSIENIAVISEAIEDYLYGREEESKGFYLLERETEDGRASQRTGGEDVIRENYGHRIKLQITNIRNSLSEKFGDKAFGFDWLATDYDSERNQGRYFLPDEGKLVWASRERTTKGLFGKKIVYTPDLSNSQDAESKYWTQDGQSIMKALIGPHLLPDTRERFNVKQDYLTKRNRELSNSNRLPPIF